MHLQNQIKRTLALPQSIEIVRTLLNSQSHKNRASVSRAVCQHFNFSDARGRPQIGGCVKALRELERVGHFVLPAPPKATVLKTPRRLDCAVPNPVNVPAQAGDVQGLCLIKVDDLELMRIWNEMMLREHPQGAGPLVGCQLRYLINSDHGWLGGFAFSAAALNLRDRDQWIGWDAQQHRQHLHRVLGMSRFLLRTSVHCHNLASCVLGMVLRQVGPDFEAQYGYRPWLVESFVDTEHFLGTCYKAANWSAIGQTQGRGRQDREHKVAKSVKTIYVYAIEDQWRAKMGVVEAVGLAALEIGQGLDADQWAAQEFGGAKLGDSRLAERLVTSAQALGAMPGRTLSGARQGDWPAVKGYYRMIDKPDDSALNAQAILAPHRERTVQRMMGQPTVLCIQDGTDLNYNQLDQCIGLGVLSKNQTGAKTRGLHLHSTFVVSTDGLPLGVLNAQFSAPAPKSETDTRPPASIPIEEKKTFCWIEGLRDCVEVDKQLPDTRQICVMDREADFFELFDEQRKTDKVDLLVRSRHDRVIGDEGGHLFESVRGSPVCGEMVIQVPRQSARAKKSKQQAKPGHVQRSATVALRYLDIELRPGVYQKDKAPIKLTVVHVQETTSSKDDEPVEWFLLTTCEVSTPEQVQQILRWYCLRWRIEDWHRVLKSGCNIEKLQHKTAERLKRTIAINLVIAWRIMLLTLLGRECPLLAAEVLFCDVEIEVLKALAKKKTA
ncbi:IS4 family transposase, partial [Rhodoferax sp.]|uniref:IS4 family transposase n=1 Tax=Rhodoferax sp. TaxID=50421 RepID=UPI00274D9CDD|nr:IS4 family transposase [Rhodoferax sp.]